MNKLGPIKIKRLPVQLERIRRWKCLCDCGNETTVAQKELTKTTGTKSCGCSTGKRHSLLHSVNLVGNRYGKLTVIAPAEPVINSKGLKRYTWLCRCDCGKEAVKSEKNLISGHTRSCGCMRSSKIIGTRFGMLTVMSKVLPIKSMPSYICRCDCGKEITASSDDLIWGTVTNCGCQQKVRQRNDLTGQKFGRLTPLREVTPILSPNGRSDKAWLCRCDCGREVVVRQHNLINKVTRSCGCLKSQKRLQKCKK